MKEVWSISGGMSVSQSPRRREKMKRRKNGIKWEVKLSRIREEGKKIKRNDIKTVVYCTSVKTARKVR